MALEEGQADKGLSGERCGGEVGCGCVAKGVQGLGSGGLRREADTGATESGRCNEEWESMEGGDAEVQGVSWSAGADLLYLSIHLSTT